MTGYQSKKAMSKAGDMMSDKGYEESTHEKQAEFASKRNQQTFYHPVSKEVIEKLIIESLQELNLKVEALRARVDSLESLNRNDGK